MTATGLHNIATPVPPSFPGVLRYHRRRRYRRPAVYRCDRSLLAFLTVFVPLPVLLLLAIVFTAAALGAFDRPSPPPLTMCVNEEGGPEVELLKRARLAMETWEIGAGRPLPVIIGGACEGRPGDHHDGVSVIGWGPARDENARGLTWSSRSRREIDVMLEETWSPEDTSCLQAVLLHELGHVLGLGHDKSRAVMANPGDCTPALPPSDVDRIRDRYPIPDGPAAVGPGSSSAD